MSKQLSDVIKSQEVINNKLLSAYYRICFLTGVNFKYDAGFRDPVKLINVFLVLLSLFALRYQYYLIWYNRNEPFIESADVICTSTQVWISMFKMIYMFCAQHEFYELMNIAVEGKTLDELGIFDLAIDCKYQLIKEIEKILKDSWWHTKRQIYTFTICCLTVCSYYMITSVLINYYYTYVNPKNITLQMPWPAMYPIWHDYGMTFPYYYIQFLISGLQNYTCGVCAVCFDGIFIVVVVHCSALFKILHRLIEHATDEEIPQSERVKYIICCAKFHEKIFRYYSKINLVFRHPVLAQCLLTILILCIVLLLANVGLEKDVILFIKMCCFFVAEANEVIIYCYNGQKIITQTELTPVAWNSCKWYNECKEFKYIITMMILRTNRTLYLQISGFSTMSHMTLLWIFRASGQYFLMLKNVSGMD